jgi:hypothetical protein
MREIDGIEAPVVVQIRQKDEERVVRVVGPSGLFH